MMSAYKKAERRLEFNQSAASNSLTLASLVELKSVFLRLMGRQVIVFMWL